MAMVAFDIYFLALCFITIMTGTKRQGGEALICCVLVPSTTVKTQVTSQEETLKVINGHNRFRAMHSQESKYFKTHNRLQNKGSRRKMLQVKDNF